MALGFQNGKIIYTADPGLENQHRLGWSYNTAGLRPEPFCPSWKTKPLGFEAGAAGKVAAHVPGRAA